MQMIENHINTALRYISQGLSVIPVSTNKTPLGPWKKYQSVTMSDEEAQISFNESTNIAAVCGAVSGNLEAIDIDKKNDPQKTIEKDFFNIVKSNHPELFSKLTIAKTVNSGFHIFYRCDSIEGNQVLAKNEEKAPIIETRGEGGYILIFPSTGYEFKKGDASTIEKISSRERDILFNVARSLTRTNELILHTQKQNNGSTHNIFSNYNESVPEHEIINLLQSHGWQPIREDNTNIFFKRPGKKENTAGATLHKQSKLFYVFTTSTEFESGKAYNPSQLLSVLESGNDMAECSKLLRVKGYEVEEIHSGKAHDILPGMPQFPIDKLPVNIRKFINHCAETYQSKTDFWAGAVIAATALAIGDNLMLDDGKYKNYPIFWICFIGSVSCGKSEPLKQLLSVFKENDKENFARYNEQKKVCDEYYSLKKSERGSEPPPDPAVFFQYLVKDYTPEALYKIHSFNNRGLAIYRDELKGWFDDFSRYTKNGEQSNLLESWYSETYVCNRKGSEPIMIPEPKINVFGTIQPGILNSLTSDNRSETGFMARMCFIYPDNDTKPQLNKNRLSEELKDDFNLMLQSIIEMPERTILTLSPEANVIYEKWYNDNVKISNDEDDQYLKGVYGKLDVIALRLAIVCYALRIFSFVDKTDPYVISAIDMEAAIDMTEHFRLTAIKVYNTISEHKKNQAPSKTEIIKYLSINRNLSQTQVAQIMGVSQQYISKILKIE